jgi:hypothetical protein
MGNRYLDYVHRLGADAAQQHFGAQVKTGQMPAVTTQGPSPSAVAAPPTPTSPTGPTATPPSPMQPPGGRNVTAAVRTMAAADFARHMQDAEYDNPTAPPPKFAGFEVDTDGIVRRTLEKLGGPRGRSGQPREARKSVSRTPVGAGSRFQVLKRKMSRKKSVAAAKHVGRTTAKRRKG